MQQQMIEVHPSQLRRAMHNLAGRGVPIQGYSPLPNGMCVIVVMVPDDAAPDAAPDWQQDAPHKRKPRTLPVNVQVSAMVLIVAAVCYVAYVMFGGAALIPSDAPDSFRAALTGVMGLTGWMLVLALAGGVFWLARPIVGAALGMVRGAAGIVGRLRR